jgi:hypothetical protein
MEMYFWSLLGSLRSGNKAKHDMESSFVAFLRGGKAD